MNKSTLEAGELSAVARELHLAFECTAELWKDQSRSDFGAQFIEPLTEEINRAAKAITQISSVLTHLHTDCQ
jgi:hypothetical protein